jgi:uncharacterized membrane protein YfcA
MEALEILILSLCSALANACGIGGGAIYSSFFLTIQQFEPSEAFPISNCIILLCSLMTFINRAIDKSRNPKTKFVNYEIAVIFGPSMILGAKLGAICNKLFNPFLLFILLGLLLIRSMYKTYPNIQIERVKEEKAEQELLMAENFGGDYTEPLIQSSARKDKMRFEDLIKNTDTIHLMTTEQKDFLRNNEHPFHIGRLCFLIICECVLFIDLIIEGNYGMHSIIGIVRCSKAYWIVFGIYILISLVLIHIGLSIARGHFALKKKMQIGDNIKTDEINDKILSLILAGIFTGVTAATVGIGGGLIINPILNNLGLDNKEASATSNLLILITGIATVISFITSGQINISYTFYLCIPCIFCAYLGSFYLLKYINETRKSSLLLVIMFYIIVLSFLMLMYMFYSQYDTFKWSELITLNAYCY